MVISETVSQSAYTKSAEEDIAAMAITTVPTKQPVLVFTHFPKTGGTILHNIISKKIPSGKVFDFVDSTYYETFLEMSYEKRDEFDYIRGHIPPCMHDFISRPCRYIILLREPLERFISDYYFSLVEPKHPNHEEYNREKITLEEHLERMIEKPDDVGITKFLLYPNMRRFGDIRRIKRWRGFYPYSMNEMIEESKRKLREDFFQVGILERFGDFVFLLSRKLGWEVPYYCIKNRNHGRPETADVLDTIDASLLSRFYETYSPEYEIYEYARSIFEEEWSESGISKLAMSRYRIMNRFPDQSLVRRLANQPIRRVRRKISRLWQ